MPARTVAETPGDDGARGRRHRRRRTSGPRASAAWSSRECPIRSSTTLSQSRRPRARRTGRENPARIARERACASRARACGGPWGTRRPGLRSCAARAGWMPIDPFSWIGAATRVTRARRFPRRARPPLGASRRRWRGSWPWSTPRRGPRTDRRRRRRRRSRRWSLRLPVTDRRRPNGSSEGHRPRPASSRRESRRRRRGTRRDGWIRHGRRCPSRTRSRRQPRRSRARPSLSRRKRAHLPNTAIVGSRTDARLGLFLKL